MSIYCPVNPQQKIKYFYFQKPVPNKQDEFVNGFYSEKNMSLISKWNNTRLDPQNKTTVHMYNVTLKHAGVYKCHFDDDYPATTVHLNVTGKRKKNVFQAFKVIPKMWVRLRIMDMDMLLWFLYTNCFGRHKTTK